MDQNVIDIFGMADVHLKHISRVVVLATLKKKENYAKSMKNWLTVISSVTFIVNTINVSNVASVFLFSFTYISSIGLAFYNISPSGEQAQIRRKRMIDASLFCVALIFISTTLGTLHHVIELIMLYLIKGSYLCFSLLAIIYTFKDDSAMVSAEDIAIQRDVRKDLHERQNNRPYEQRDKKIRENEKTRSFVTKKKPGNKEEVS